MKNKLLTLAGALGLLATLGHFYAKPLLAQVRAALIRDVDNPARNAVQFVFYNSGAATYHVPAGKVLVIEEVSFQTIYGNAGTYCLSTTVKGVKAAHCFAPVGYAAAAVPTNGNWYGGRTTRIYSDSETDVHVGTVGQAGLGYGVFSGYLIDASM